MSVERIQQMFNVHGFSALYLMRYLAKECDRLFMNKE